MRLKPGYLIVFYVVVIFIVALILPTEPDWSPKYGLQHDEPLGGAIIYNELEHIFQENAVDNTQVPIFNTLRQDSGFKNYIFINDQFTPDELDVNHLLSFIQNGGNAFISAEYISYQFLDTLGIYINSGYNLRIPFVDDTIYTQVHLTDSVFNDRVTRVEGVVSSSYLDTFYSDSFAVYDILGVAEDSSINFIRMPMGRGDLYVHMCPVVFTNYSMLYTDAVPYVSACLSYLPEGRTIFDNYYKSGIARSDGNLSVIFAHPPLRWAWNIALISVVLFMIFGARRKVRPIPVIEPHSNDSLDYIFTVGSMFYNYRNNRLIAKKRWGHFTSFMKKRYGVEKDWWTYDQIDELQRRTPLSMDSLNSLINAQKWMMRKGKVEPESLRKFDTLIEKVRNELKK